MYISLGNIPYPIRDRVYLNEHEATIDALIEACGIADSFIQDVLGIMNDVLLLKVPLGDVAKLAQERLKIDEEAAHIFAAKAYELYFLLFQDLVGDVKPNIKDDKDFKQYIDRAKRLLAPERQLQEYVESLLIDADLSELEKESIEKLAAAILDRAEGKITTEELKQRVIEGVGKTPYTPIDIDTLTDTIEARVIEGECNPDWAWYYRNLPELVLNAKRNIYEIDPPFDAIEEERTESNAYRFFSYRAHYLLAHAPDDVRATISREDTKKNIKDLEAKYEVSLATLITLVAIKDITLEEMAVRIQTQRDFEIEEATAIKKEVVDTILTPILASINTQQGAGVPAPIAATVSAETPKSNPPSELQPSPVDTAPALRTYTVEDYEAFAAALIAESGIMLTDATLANRFRGLIVTRLRDVRDAIETREKLEAPIDQGGVGLSRAQTDPLLKRANTLTAEIRSGKAMLPAPATKPTTETGAGTDQKQQAWDDIETKAKKELESLSNASSKGSSRPPQPPMSKEEKQRAWDNLEAKAKKEFEALAQEKKESSAQQKQGAKTQVSTPPTPAQPTATPITGRSRSHNNAFGVTGQPAPATSTPAAPSSTNAQIPTPTNLAARATVMAIEEIDGIPTIVERPAGSLPHSDSSRGHATPLMPRPRQQQNMAQRFERPGAKAQGQGTAINVRQGVGDVSPYKVSVADVTFTPTLVDPVQELKLFTVRDFRRLSKDPRQASKRIFQKIKLLEQESQTKKANGIQAWKESEVAKLYAEIGSESFGKGLPLDTVIASRRQAGKETFTEEELDALLELNEMLRF